uniref:Inner centromere protein ARK-binding domain-containing protein n=1 Tax=Tetraodon nigroviridis TaxID=99883 RepID=H3DF80_TETNG
MSSVKSSMQSLREMFVGKTQEFIDEITNVHLVWLDEIQQEASRMFSSDFNAEPELMPKTPSQKKNSRRRRVSVGRQEENQSRRRYSRGRRSNLRSSSVKVLNFITEEESVPGASDVSYATRPKRTTRKDKQTKFEETEDASHAPETAENKKPEPAALQEMDEKSTADDGEDKPGQPVPQLPAPEVATSVSSAHQFLSEKPAPEVTVSISSADRLSAEKARSPEGSPGRTATKVAIANGAQNARRSSVALKLRHSVAGLRHSLTQESVRRASRRSMLKRKAARATNSQCNSNEDRSFLFMVPEIFSDAVEEEAEVCAFRLRSLQIQLSGVLLARRLQTLKNRQRHPCSVPSQRWARPAEKQVQNLSLVRRSSCLLALNEMATSERRSRQSTKRKAPDTAEESPMKRMSPPKPHMRSFLHAVQKNQVLMMTPNTLGRSGVIKSFIKHTTPLRIDPKTKERHKLEAQRSTLEPWKEKLSTFFFPICKLDPFIRCRKRDERLKRVFEAKVKEEQREEEKKKKVEQKMAQIEEKNEVLTRFCLQRLAEEKAKKKAAAKRQEELEQKKKMEEEARKKKLKEEEKRQQELLAKKKAEEEEQARKLAEARRALELKREQERERERQLERERLAAAERERVEKEKALALQRELQRAAREKERRELEEKRKLLEEKRRQEEAQRLAAEQRAAKEREAAAKQREAAAKQAAPALNVTVDIEKSPQSYVITPKGGNKPVFSKSAEDYGMDQNSDDSTDDESAPRKPIPSWADSHNLHQIIMKQYFNPPDLNSFFGVIEPPKLEDIFYKSKPRYFKRTSSAVWHLPPMSLSSHTHHLFLYSFDF